MPRLRKKLVNAHMIHPVMAFSRKTNDVAIATAPMLAAPVDQSQMAHPTTDTTRYPLISVRPRSILVYTRISSLKGPSRVLDRLPRIFSLHRGVSKHLDAVNVRVAVHDPAGHRAARVGCGLAGRPDADHGPANQEKVEEQPGKQRKRKPCIRVAQENQGPRHVGRGEGQRVKRYGRPPLLQRAESA